MMHAGLIGPIVDLVVPASTGTSVASYPGTGFDFAVDDLLFKVAPSDNFPYERATAQFRKEQLDTGQQAGDQSLTGWWTRGQFSFHKGAGVTYYETSEGDTIANRFREAEGLDPFRAGALTCQKAWVARTAAVTNIKHVSSIGTDLVVLDGSTVKYGNFNGVPTTLVPAGGGTVTGVTVSPTRGYIVTTAGKIESFVPGGAQTVLYTGLTATPRGIWYVKSRLIVADSDGKWYQLAASPTAPPVAVAGGDVIFSGADWEATSVVCDSPGPVLIGNSNRVFAATVDNSTGSIPVLSAPVQVAELPPGEIISAMAHHLGMVVIVTGAGVRIGVLSDSGQLTYGPLLVERDVPDITPPVTSIARYGTRASVVVDNTIIEIDLAHQVGQGLEFAWTGRGDPFTGAETAAGVSTLGYTTRVAWSQAGLWADDANLLEGSLFTGFHRFATLEPKRFDSVRIHLAGTSGTVNVVRVMPDGTELSLITLDVSQTHGEDVPLRLSTGEEAVGLKFVLAPSAGAPTVSPTLLGYQLRALPDPSRQRMIRVPLMMKDVEGRRPTRGKGHTGSAWSRLQELENLETSRAIVAFRDFRTGESGRAYIESVEFRNVTPPTEKSTGFGGTAFLTLRKL